MGRTAWAAAAAAAGLLAAVATQQGAASPRAVALATLLGAVGVLAAALQQQQQQPRGPDAGRAGAKAGPRAAGPAAAKGAAADFEAAQAFATSGALGRLGNEQQLELYAWYKQATAGDCTAPKPSMLDFVGQAKWTAWRKAKGSSPEEARAAYVGLVEDLAPGWRTLDEAAVRERQQQAASADAATGSGDPSSAEAMAPRVSTFALEEEKSHADQTQAERLLTLAGRGERDELVAALKAAGCTGPDRLRTVVGADKESLLHMACDRNDTAMVDALIDLGADLEARDVDGLTPLGYALMNDHADLARHLVGFHGADMHAKGDDGDPILSMCGPTLAQALREEDEASRAGGA